MDAQDVADIAEAIGEFYDQTCTIYRGTGGSLGSFPCLVLPMGAAGGVTGMSPDPADAAAAGLGTWRIHLPIAAEPVVVAGSRITTSRTGQDLAIVGSDAGRSIPAYLTISAAEQEIATTPVMIILRRWNESTLTWDELPPQEFQTLVRNDTETGTPPFGFVRREATVTLVGPTGRDVEIGDQFTWEGGAGEIFAVHVSDRTEAVGKVHW